MCSIEGLLLLLIDEYDCDLFLWSNVIFFSCLDADSLTIALTDVRRRHEHDVHRDDDEQWARDKKTDY